jgi:hypothetical protein
LKTNKKRERLKQFLKNIKKKKKIKHKNPVGG